MILGNEICVIIPVYNEAKVIKSTLDLVLKHAAFAVCVDDGSTDNSADIIAESKAHLVGHAINMGQGAALQTGIDYALQFDDVEYFVTFDSDGQHSILDVKKMLKVLKDRDVEIVLGSRFLGSTIKMSQVKRTLLKSAILFTNISTGLKLTDTHNGLRVFSRKVATDIDLQLQDFAHASEFIEKIAKNKYSYAEVPVTITYTKYTMAKGQSIVNSVNILFDILLDKLVKR